MTVFRKIINALKNFKRLFGYEKVGVVSVKKSGASYSLDDEIKVSRQWRKYYRVDVKNALFNIKNYVKYLFNRNYEKDMHGKPYYKYIYMHKQYAGKKHDFAVISKNLIEIAKRPISLHRKTIGYIDRSTLKKGE